MNFNSKVLLVVWVMVACSAAYADDKASNAKPKPKYASQATVISKSHDYFRHAPAPDYWALSPYYTAQQNESSCSIASVTMVVNAARVAAGLTDQLTADDELATQKNVLERTASEEWKKAVEPGGHGVTLDQLGKYVEASLKAFKIEGAAVEVVHTPDSGEATVRRLHQALIENEKSNHDLIILNFVQGFYTGDTPVGHIAPLGAYDSKGHRALVMDPDRTWYEPYWVSEEVLLAGMATDDPSSGKSRGFVWVKLKKN